MPIVTENNKPNRKVNAGGIAAVIMSGIVLIAPIFGFNLDQAVLDIVREQIEYLILGIGAVIYIVQWFVRPGKGDGIKEI